MNKSKIKRREDKNDNVFLKLFLGGILGFVVFAVFVFAFAFVELKSGMGEELYLPALIVFAVLSGFVNGFISVRPFKRAGAPYGAVSGFVQSVLTFALVFAANRASAGKWLFIITAAIVFSSVIGGIIAANLRIRKKY